MKKTVTAIALAAVPFGFSATAIAADVGSNYVGLSGMASMIGDVDASNSRSGASEVRVTADMETSYGALFRVGHQFTQFRAELELGYRSLDIDSLSTSSGALADASGDGSAYSAMVNAAYDFSETNGFTPYVMAGVGALKVSNAGLSYTDDHGRTQTETADATTIAGQIGAGVSYKINDDIDFVGGYTFMGAPTDKTGVDEVLQIHSLQVGLNYNF